MKKISIHQVDRAALAVHHRAFQAAVGRVASEKLGSQWTGGGIFKYEGGVTVNGREIVIKNNLVFDDYDRDHGEKPEELAVAEAIEELVVAFNATGPAALEGEPLHNLAGDPLRSFFDFGMVPPG